jgi:16S rRNA C967 or C1407 C5-methylase (RsmB/RsmF family)
VRAGADVAAVAAELGCALTPVPYLPGYYQCPATVPLAHTTAFRTGVAQGGDVSSGVAVEALGVQRGDDCLDLCCAPGNKMAALAERAAPDGSVTGVDVDRTRLAACATLLRRVRAGRIRLYRADGRAFAVEAPPLGTRDRATLAACADRTGTATRPMYASSFLRGCPDLTGRGYDRVLVDAECTHDGSVAHLHKARAQAWTSFVTRGLDPDRVAALPALQLALLRQGFALARPRGGTVVYATCSRTRAQNEAVVAAFLATTPDATLVPTGVLGLPPAAYVRWPPDPADGGVRSSSSSNYHNGDDHPGMEAQAPHVLRLDPERTGTSGLFVAKFVKQ